MTIRKRIFTVIGVVIAAAFLQTLIVLEVENRRAAAASLAAGRPRPLPCRVRRRT